MTPPQAKISVDVVSETGRLKEVLVAPAVAFKIGNPINNTQRHYFKTSPPSPQAIVRQHDQFVDALRNNHVKVHLSIASAECPLQLNVRDVATVVGNTMVVCSLKESIRQLEPRTLDRILQELDCKLLRVDEGVVEGGDIQLSSDRMFVGISQRTNPAGQRWIAKHFEDEYNVIPIELRSPFLHLDVVFNLVGRNFALIYPPAIAASSLKLLEREFNLIEVTEEEQFRLECNILSVSPTLAIVDRSSARVNAILKSNGIQLIELDFGEVRKLGGSFRCATCPIVRESVD